MVGGAQKVLEMSVEYAKVRVQFGRPIGSFQAIKHKCADMLLEVESGKSAAYYAAWAAAEDNDELPVVASLAKAYCSDAYFHAAAENIQIHGGIGFTWEHDAHLYFKRGEELRDPPRRRHVPPRAARAAHRHLTRCTLTRSRAATRREPRRDRSVTFERRWPSSSCSSVSCSRCSAVLVAGLLRSHAEILRALHDLGVDLDPRTPTGAAPSRVGRPRRCAARSCGAPRSPAGPGAPGVDVAGTTPGADAVSIAVAGTDHLTLLAFLTSGCRTCSASGTPSPIPGSRSPATPAS